jgi:hypothetical protein
VEREFRRYLECGFAPRGGAAGLASIRG